jgi:glycosyltransferase involved in cell wall biosynthesis
MEKIEVRYPIFVPSKGRAKSLLTSKMFLQDGVPFRLVVEPQEVDAYAAEVGSEHVISLPENNRGLVYSRNWIKDYATSEGHARHWQFDDDIVAMIRTHGGRKLYCASNLALAAAEDFVDRYENAVLASFNSEFFVAWVVDGTTRQMWPPFYRNARCYTCFLIDNRITNRWRGRANEDTDMSLQVLADGQCTILFNAFSIRTPVTMSRPGGQMNAAYMGEGRLAMAREMERYWPGTVEVYRRFGRSQHHVKHEWQRFDTPLKLRADAAPVRDYGFELREMREVKSSSLKAFLEAENAKRAAP